MHFSFGSVSFRPLPPLYYILYKRSCYILYATRFYNFLFEYSKSTNFSFFTVRNLTIYVRCLIKIYVLLISNWIIPDGKRAAFNSFRASSYEGNNVYCSYRAWRPAETKSFGIEATFSHLKNNQTSTTPDEKQSTKFHWFSSTPYVLYIISGNV